MKRQEHKNRNSVCKAGKIKLRKKKNQDCRRKAWSPSERNTHTQTLTCTHIHPHYQSRGQAWSLVTNQSAHVNKATWWMITFLYLHLSDDWQKLRMNPHPLQKKREKKRVQPRASRIKHHILFSFLHFLISSYALMEKWIPTKPGHWGVGGAYRDKERG